MPPPIDTFVAPPCHEQIDILFQDEHLLLIDKPSGLLSLSGKNPLNYDSVHYRLMGQFPAATLVHRLDFGTSGIMVVALSKSVNGHLTRQFQARSVEKSYMALLAGHLSDGEGRIDLPIAKDRANFPRLRVCHQTGQPATSCYEVVERLEEPSSSRVVFTPETGRTHQLRIHSQAIGHPILGCDLYGTEQSEAMADRLMLHALTLAFDHPISSERVVARSPCPF